MEKYRVYYHPDDELTPNWVCADYHSERTLVAACRSEAQATVICDALNRGGIRDVD